MTWIQTYTGQRFDLAHPDVETIDIVDIAHALAHQCRFNGHMNSFYSVAQHSVEVANKCGPDPRAQLVALLHDAHEAYTGDIVTPMKRLLGGKLARLEEDIQAAIYIACEVDIQWVQDYYPAIKQADLRMMVTERQNMMADIDDDWGVRVKPYLVGPADGLMPEAAKEQFLIAYDGLQKRCDQMLMDEVSGLV